VANERRGGRTCARVEQACVVKIIKSSDDDVYGIPIV